MFESVVSKIRTAVGGVMNAVGAAVRSAPWLTAATVLMLIFLVMQ
jgi:hypothetical protein